jgi:hypothetical protein
MPLRKDGAGMSWITGSRSYRTRNNLHPRGQAARLLEKRAALVNHVQALDLLLYENRPQYDDEVPVSPQELELIRRDTIQAERMRSRKAPNFAGDYR